MNSPRQNDMNEPLKQAEETLRLIAALPAPDGLVERVQGRVQKEILTASRPFFLSRSFGLARDGWMYSPALRCAAAAVIVCVVAGGGWSIYSRVQQAPITPANVTVPRMGPGGGFSAAGAMRTPDTLKGPVLTHAVVPTPKAVDSAGAAGHPATHATKSSRVAAHKKKAAPSQ